jgi:hypothetical protein
MFIDGIKSFALPPYFFNFWHMFAGGKIKKNEMDWACDTYGGGERCAQGFGGEAWGKETIGETQT